jgi:hypothetical protein
MTILSINKGMPNLTNAAGGWNSGQQRQWMEGWVGETAVNPGEAAQPGEAEGCSI